MQKKPLSKNKKMNMHPFLIQSNSKDLCIHSKKKSTSLSFCINCISSPLLFLYNRFFFFKSLCSSFFIKHQRGWLFLISNVTNVNYMYNLYMNICTFTLHNLK